MEFSRRGEPERSLSTGRHRLKHERVALLHRYRSITLTDQTVSRLTVISVQTSTRNVPSAATQVCMCACDSSNPLKTGQLAYQTCHLRTLLQWAVDIQEDRLGCHGTSVLWHVWCPVTAVWCDGSGQSRWQVLFLVIIFCHMSWQMQDRRVEMQSM